MKRFKNMKSRGLMVLLLTTGLVLSSFVFSPSNNPEKPGDPLQGAWELQEIRGQSAGELDIRMVKIISGGHFIFAFFNDESQQFFSAGGGKYSYKDGTYTEEIEFHTIDPKLVGKSLKFKAEIKGEKWFHSGKANGETVDEVFQRIDKNKGSEHIGAWEIWRLSNDAGKMIPQRKGVNTIKILSGTRFQWASWDSKGSFINTGGGTYETKEGYYTENIEFFSPDSLRVGQEITFGCDIREGAWHHEEYAGSRGMPINEIWTRMKK